MLGALSKFLSKPIKILGLEMSDSIKEDEATRAHWNQFSLNLNIVMIILVSTYVYDLKHDNLCHGFKVRGYQH